MTNDFYAPFQNVFLSLGSNDEDALMKLEMAISAINGLPGCQIACISPVFLTEPQENRNQPWFHNLALMLHAENKVEPGGFLTLLQEIEKQLGRNRNAEKRYGPRPIDIDIILFGEHESDDEFCLLPHPSAYKRAFVLLPLLTIAPWLRINKQSLQGLLSFLDWRIKGWKIWQN